MRRCSCLTLLVVVLLLAGSLHATVWASVPAVSSYDTVPGPSSTTAVLYMQPASPAGGLILSSLRDPDGSAADQWIWDGFTLTSTADVSEVRWSGGYDPGRNGMGGKVHNFTVSIFPSTSGLNQPDVAHPPLVRYEVGGNAGETPGSVLGGVQMYDYAYVLPAAFHAVGGTKYWVQIEAYQPGSLPDWGLTKATSGDGSYFSKIAGETQYRTLTGDTSFSLLGTPASSAELYLPIIMR